MNSKPLLLLSILLNLVLIGVLAVPRKSEMVATGIPPLASSANTEQAALQKSPPEKAPTGTRTIMVRTNTLDWRAVESGDYKEYIANLRSVGCPEETIRDIIIADVGKLFDDRKKALRKPADKFKFWETGSAGMQKMLGNVFDEETIKQNQALAAEKRALLKELLGVEVAEKPDLMAAANVYEQLFDFIPSSKQTRVMEIMQQFQAKQMKRIGSGSADEVDMKEIQKAQKAMETELAGILTPQEFDDYQLRLSQTATVMRMQMDGFSPTEQEFRDIYKLQKGFDDEYGLLGSGTGTDKESMAKKNAAQKELDDKVKSLLGDERFGDLQREKDYAYKAIAKVADREGLPKEAGVKVYGMKKVAEDQANKVRMDKSLNAEQRAAALEGIRAETERGVTTVLGSKGYDSYTKGNNAYWLRGISPDKKTATKAP